MMGAVIYWFRRDLRISDSRGLARALRIGDVVVPVFIVDPAMHPGGDQPAARTVMWRALAALDEDLQAVGSRLICRFGDAAAIMPVLVRESGAIAVVAARKQGRAFIERDERTRRNLEQMGCPFILEDDDVLVPHDALLNGSGKPYSVFTPFSRAWLDWLKDHEPRPEIIALRKLALPEALRSLPGRAAEALPGGAAAENALPQFPISTSAAQARLAAFTGVHDAGAIDRAAPIARYHLQRDLPAVDGTSRMSAHLAWGTISIRAAYLAALMAGRAATDAGRDGARVWVTELAWRDFYHHLLIHAPHGEYSAYLRMYASVAWEGDADHLVRWQAGQTGYPIVDAGMRQLNQSGWMHNRVRMIVASFLVKDLLLNWQRGEAYFAQRLIDHDIASNNGGWQWSASTGTDAQPYFRVFNPTAQGERYDPDGAYVRQWVPEVVNVPIQAIHAPWKLTLAERRVACPEYPPPIVDHAAQRPRAIAMFARARAASTAER